MTRKTSIALFLVLAAAGCLSAAREAGDDGGLASLDAGSDGGRDAGFPDGGTPDGGTGPDSGGGWDGFPGLCSTLVAPLQWLGDGGGLCPIRDGGTEFVDLLRDDGNCGTCEISCAPGVHCSSGHCQGGLSPNEPYTCTAELPDGSMSTYKTSLESNVDCGGCGCACPPGMECVASSGFQVSDTPWGVVNFPVALCIAPCGGNEGACYLSDGGFYCVQVLTDPENCGFCGNVCTSGTICIRGYCRPDAG